jgi:hypothetical protein
MERNEEISAYQPVVLETADGVDFTVSERDADWVCKWHWRLDKQGYLIRGMREYGYFVVKRLSRELALRNGMLKEGECNDYGVYFKDGNKLNLCPDNLIVKPKKFKRDKTSIGIKKDKRTGMWRANADLLGKLVFIGMFPTKTQARQAIKQYEALCKTENS